MTGRVCMLSASVKEPEGGPLFRMGSLQMRYLTKKTVVNRWFLIHYVQAYQER